MKNYKGLIILLIIILIVGIGIFAFLVRNIVKSSKQDDDYVMIGGVKVLKEDAENYQRELNELNASETENEETNDSASEINSQTSNTNSTSGNSSTNSIGGTTSDSQNRNRT